MKLSLPLVAFLSLSSLGLAAEGEKPAHVKYAEDLAKIPPKDPPATHPPQIVAALRGQHPRLLFTTAEIDELKKRIAGDPLLKKAADQLDTWAKRFKAPKDNPPAIVLGDTAALAAGTGQYASLAYAYALDPDPAIRQAIIDVLTIMLAQPYWADAIELDCNMGAGNNMFMVALLFDSIAKDLEPTFRRQLEEKLLTHARRMFYLGHKELALDVIKYWQQDPQNNHRWHRDCGLSACLLAISDVDGLDTGYLLEQLQQEMNFIVKWYPPDGDCHEGAGYQRFGFFYLAMAARMNDRVLGTEYLKAPGFRNAWLQQLYFWVPASGSDISFGDDMNTPGTFGHLDAAFFLCPDLTRDKDLQAALKRRFDKLSVRKDGRPTDYPWSLLSFYDPSVGEGDYRAIPTSHLLADLGAATMRDNWDDSAVIFAFKCGPYGGYKLNEYRESVTKPGEDLHYINVAHDDPDANCFSLGIADDFLFHPGVYSTKKLTENSNTLTVDGKGQINEGDSFTQPVPKVDMRTLSYVTGWKQGEHGRVIIEGEAGKTYPALKQFRRTVIFMPGEYILILDNIVADGIHQLTWRASTDKAKFDDAADGLCSATSRSGKRLDFQMLANKEFTGAIDYLFLAGRFGSRLMQQFQFSINSDAVKFACLLDPWKRKPSLTLKESGDTVTLTVKSATFEDTWTWQNPAGDHTPSSITGTRASAPLFALTPTDKAPTE
ncbi:hypothetical protein BH09VER1_BH09VER1_13100 [soil metagenome]